MIRRKFKLRARLNRCAVTCRLTGSGRDRPLAVANHCVVEVIMSIATRVEAHIRGCGKPYDIVTHARSLNSAQTAEAAHVPGDKLIKCVVLRDDQGYVVAVLASTGFVRIGKLDRELKRKLRLATEAELRNLFTDCELGSIPPLGAAYGLKTVMDDSLANQPEVFFEAGDHECLIHMRGADFMALLQDAGHARFSRRPRLSSR